MTLSCKTNFFVLLLLATWGCAATREARIAVDDLPVVLHGEACVRVAWAQTRADSEGVVVEGAVVRRPLCRESFLAGHVDIDVLSCTKDRLQSCRASISPSYVPLRPPRRSYFRGRLKPVPEEGAVVHVRFHRGAQTTGCANVPESP